MASKPKNRHKLAVHCSRVKLPDKTYQKGHHIHEIVFNLDGTVQCKDHRSHKDLDTLRDYRAMKALAGTSIDMYIPACMIIADEWEHLLHMTSGHKVWQGWYNLANMLVRLVPRETAMEKIIDTPINKRKAAVHPPKNARVVNGLREFFERTRQNLSIQFDPNDMFAVGRIADEINYLAKQSMKEIV